MDEVLNKLIENPLCNISHIDDYKEDISKKLINTGNLNHSHINKQWI